MTRRREVELKAMLHHLGGQLDSALKARGVQVRFKRIYANKSIPTFGFFEVEAAGLTTNVQPDFLSKSDTEHFLSQVLGYRVKAMNGKGLTYCVLLKE
jgi:hypothetical protein